MSEGAVSAERALDDLLTMLQHGDLSPRELRVLLSLAERDATQSQLADDLHVNRSAISRASRQLAMRGLINRRFEHGRTPRFSLTITPEGLSALAPLIDWMSRAHPASKDEVWQRARGRARREDGQG